MIGFSCFRVERFGFGVWHFVFGLGIEDRVRGLDTHLTPSRPPHRGFA